MRIFVIFFHHFIRKVKFALVGYPHIYIEQIRSLQYNGVKTLRHEVTC